jgi:hypothetical protein
LHRGRNKRKGVSEIAFSRSFQKISVNLCETSVPLW